MRHLTLILLIAGAFLVSATRGDDPPTPTPEPVTPADARRQLETTILPLVEVVDMPIPVFVAQLQVMSRRADPSGAGVNIVYLRPTGGPPASNREATVSVTLRDIPVGEALRYACLGASDPLTYTVERHAVLVHHPLYTPLPRYTRAFALPYWLSGRPAAKIGSLSLLCDPATPPAPVADPEPPHDASRPPPKMPEPPPPPTPEQRDAALREDLTAFGANFGPGSSVHYVESSRRLVVTNTAAELQRIEGILATIIPPVRQPLVELTVIRVTAPAVLRDHRSHRFTAEELEALPAETREVIYRRSVIVTPGQTARLHDEQATQSAGTPARLTYDAALTPIFYRRIPAVEVKLAWTMRLVAVDQPDAELAAATVTTTISHDTETPAVFALQTVRGDDPTSQLFLIVRSAIVTVPFQPTPPPLAPPSERETLHIATTRDIIIPRLELRNATVRETHERLQALSKAHDPAGKGLLFVYPRIAEPDGSDWLTDEDFLDEDHKEPTPPPREPEDTTTRVHLQLSNISLYDAIRYAELRTGIDGLFAPDRDKTEGLWIHVSHDAWSKSRAFLGADEQIETFMPRFGVSFPKGYSISQFSSASIDSRNTRENNDRINALATAMTAHIIPQTMQTNLTLIHVTDQAFLNARGLQGITWDMLQALPAASRVVVHQTVLRGKPGEAAAVADVQTVGPADDRLRLRHEATVTTGRCDFEHIHATLDWRFRLEPVGAADAPARMDVALQTVVVSASGEPRLFAVSTPMAADRPAGQYFLLVQSQPVDPIGRGIYSLDGYLKAMMYRELPEPTR